MMIDVIHASAVVAAAAAATAMEATAAAMTAAVAAMAATAASAAAARSLCFIDWQHPLPKQTNPRETGRTHRVSAEWGCQIATFRQNYILLYADQGSWQVYSLLGSPLPF